MFEGVFDKVLASFALIRARLVGEASVRGGSFDQAGL